MNTPDNNSAKGKHTFGNLVSHLSNHMHCLLNLYSDFPEYRVASGNPTDWTTEQQHAFLSTVMKEAPERFSSLGYYMSEGELNWVVDKKFLP